jgi:hypothetical protein
MYMLILNFTYPLRCLRVPLVEYHCSRSPDLFYEDHFKSLWTHLITPSRNFVEVRWRSLFRVPPLASDAILTTLYPLLENVLQTVDHFEISCLIAPFSWLEKPKNRRARDLNWVLCSAWKKWIGGTPSEHSPYSPDLARCDFWAFPTMKRELRSKKFRSDQRSAARFREVGGAL